MPGYLSSNNLHLCLALLVDSVCTEYWRTFFFAEYLYPVPKEKAEYSNDTFLLFEFAGSSVFEPIVHAH